MPWEGILAFIGVALTALVGYWTAKRNTKSAEKQTETEQVPHIIDGYNSLLEATRTTFEKRFQDLENDNIRKMDGYREQLSELPELKEKVKRLEQDKEKRDESHRVSMKYIRDTFEGLRDGTVPPIRPVPELIAGEFDGNLISALLVMTAAHEDKWKGDIANGHAPSTGSLSGNTEL